MTYSASLRLGALALSSLLTAACMAPGSQGTNSSLNGATPASAFAGYTHSFQPDLPISSPPYAQVHANWKQRIDQPYVYVDFVGSYTETGRLLPMVHRALQEQGLEPSGPPFALYFDDPGQVAVERLRSRACMPVSAQVPVSGAIAFAVLPSTTVVYAFASGAYPDVPRAYAGMFKYMSDSGWVENGPIRETYLIDPNSTTKFEDLVTEIQIPVTFAR